MRIRIRFIYTLLVFAFTFSLAACGADQENIKNSGNEVITDTLPSSQTSGTEQNVNVEEPTETGKVDSSAFSGKVSGCYYAADNKIIVAADKLYLYDTQMGKSIASADIILDELCVQSYSDGYFIVGEENSNGMKGYLLSKDFAIENTIFFHELPNNDFILSTAAVAISENGKEIAIGGLQGLYLYDILTEKMSTVLNYSKDAVVNNTQLLEMDSLAFLGNENLAYTGIGTDSSNGENDLSVYGTVSIDNKKLSITTKSNYDIGEMQKGGNLLIMPQSGNKVNGTLLMVDTVSNSEKIIECEDKDGVFCSQQGKYVATAVLGNNSVTVNIYDTESEKNIHSETVKADNSTYFYRAPQILILDGSNTCIVILGRGISEVSTLIKTFGF